MFDIAAVLEKSDLLAYVERAGGEPKGGGIVSLARVLYTAGITLLLFRFTFRMVNGNGIALRVTAAGEMRLPL